jgi:mycothiol synthase
MDKTLTLRLDPASDADFDRLLEIQRESARRIGDAVGLTRADLVAMTSWSRIGPDGLQVIRDEGTTVGFLRYGRFLDARPPHVLAIITIDPEFRGADIADWVYAQVLERARADGAEVLDTAIDRRDQEAKAFLVRLGFEPVVSVWTMEADPNFAPAEPPQVPAGFALRTYRKGEDSELLTDLFNRTFDRHVTFFPSTVEDTRSIEATPAFDPALTLLLETDRGEPVAYGRNTLRGDVRDGWIDVLGVVPEYQGRGLGRFMLLQCMYVLAQARPKTIRLSLEATNETARALYDSEGFMEVRTRLRYRKPL